MFSASRTQGRLVRFRGAESALVARTRMNPVLFYEVRSKRTKLIIELRENNLVVALRAFFRHNEFIARQTWWQWESYKNRLLELGEFY